MLAKTLIRPRYTGKSLISFEISLAIILKVEITLIGIVVMLVVSEAKFQSFEQECTAICKLLQECTKTRKRSKLQN